MNNSEFYMLDENLSSTTVQAHPMGLNRKKDDNGLDDVARLLMGNYLRIDFPVIFKQKYGKRYDDIIRTGTAILFLISDRMKQVLEDNGISGWKTFEIKLLDKKDSEIRGFHGLYILGRCGKINFSMSEIIKKKLVPEGPVAKYYKGLYVGLNEWDGSDLFLPKDFFGIVATAKTAEILKKSKLTNIQLKNLAEIEIPKVY